MGAIVDPDLYGANYIDNKIYEYPLSRVIHDQFDKNVVSTIMKELKNLDKKKLNQSKNYSEYVSNLAGNYLSKKFFKSYPENCGVSQIQNCQQNLHQDVLKSEKKEDPSILVKVSGLAY